MMARSVRKNETALSEGGSLEEKTTGIQEEKQRRKERRESVCGNVFLEL
jgi:hypothetical protein